MLVDGLNCSFDVNGRNSKIQAYKGVLQKDALKRRKKGEGKKMIG